MELLYKNLEEFGYGINRGRISARTLTDTLKPDEKILSLIECVHKTTVGLLLATEFRILYIGRNLFNQEKILQIPYFELLEINFIESKLPYTGSLQIICVNQLLKINACIPEKAKNFIDQCFERKNQYRVS